MDAASSLAHDQLSKMFPTPPSNDNHVITSPPENLLELHDGPASVKGCGPSSVASLSELGMLEGLDPADWSFSASSEGSMSVMLASSLFAPLHDLYSEKQGSLTLTEVHYYKARTKSQLREQQHQQQHGSGQNSVSAPLGTPGGGQHKPGVSPIASPRSHHGPGSNYGHGDIASPASSSSFNKASTPSGNGASKGGSTGAAAGSAAAVAGGSGISGDSSKTPEANSLLLNLVLSDTLLNVFRDHNFDSCTLCVCSNEGNVRGRDASVYLPPSELGSSGSQSGASSSGSGGGGGGGGGGGAGGDGAGEDVNCSCGFSAVVNRRLAHQSGLFYEDETEITSITEDLYYRKKPSLLLLDPKGHHHHHHHEDGEGAGSNSAADSFAAKSAEVDSVPGPLMDLIIRQSSFWASSQNALLRYSRHYLRTVVQPTTISMVEVMDGNDVIFAALQQVKNVTAPLSSGSGGGAGKEAAQIQTAKLDEAQKGTCLHKWALLPSPGPLCSEDIIRVMKSLQPLLNRSLHSPGGISTSLRKQPPTPASAASADGSSKSDGKSAAIDSKKPSAPVVASSNLSVQGPLTWRQFHRMAGPATKGNTDDQVEPLPVPSITLGHERDFLSISPLALHFWESLGLEPFSGPRDVVYVVVAPDNEFLVGKVKRFFKNLSNTYELCRLGMHVPYVKMVRDGILKVGKLAANKISNSETQRWFDLIGDFPTAALLKLYSQVM